MLPTHTTPSARRGGRALGLVRLGWAAALLAAPDRVVRLLGGTPDPASRHVARILGGRHAAQAVVELVWWPRWRRTGVALDAAHAATALALAAFDGDRRRVGLSDTAVASSFALVGAAR